LYIAVNAIKEVILYTLTHKKEVLIKKIAIIFYQQGISTTYYFRQHKAEEMY